MNSQLLVALLVCGFSGLLVASLLSLSKSTYHFASKIFLLANFLNFLAGLLFLINYSGHSLSIAKFDWFFGFQPTLSFLAAFFLTTISLVSGLVGIYSLRYLQLYKNTYNIYLTHSLMAIFVFGMQAVLVANNTFSFLFFWELMSISSFLLVLADKSKESFTAAFIYFFMTHLGAAAILSGFLILGSGSLLFDFSNIANASQSLSPLMLATAFGLLLFCFGSKAGLVPFHIWLPEAHPQAPSNISALMSGLMLKVAIYGFLVVVLNFSALPSWAGLVVISLGLLSGLLGALYANLVKDIKRVFAYSSIENMGIVFTMIGLAIYLKFNQPLASLAALFIPLLVFALIHSLSHAFFKTALFLSSGLIISKLHTRTLNLMGGLAKRLPLFSFFFLLAILGSLPLAPLLTFFGEWGFIHALLEVLANSETQKYLLVLVVAILSALGLIGGLAAMAMVRVFALSMLGLPREQHSEIAKDKGDNLLLVPIAILALLPVILGVFANFLITKFNLFLNSSNSVSQSTNSGLSSLTLFLIIASALLVAYLLNWFFAQEKSEDAYHTWDCGQPITGAMQYSATGFSAPIRFFFSSLIGRTKDLTSRPAISTNKWIRDYSFAMKIRQPFKEMAYQPVANSLLKLANKLKVIQSGRIQYYLLFLLVTLIIVLIIALWCG